MCAAFGFLLNEYSTSTPIGCRSKERGTVSSTLIDVDDSFQNNIE
jgi:hypothetical protein